MCAIRVPTSLREAAPPLQIQGWTCQDMFLKARKLVPTHHSLLLRLVAGLRERTARDTTLQGPLGLVERKREAKAERGCKEGFMLAAAATQGQRGSGGPYHHFSEKEWGVPNRDSQISEEFTSTQTPKKCDPKTKTLQKVAKEPVSKQSVFDPWKPRGRADGQTWPVSDNWSSVVRNLFHWGSVAKAACFASVEPEFNPQHPQERGQAWSHALVIPAQRSWRQEDCWDSLASCLVLSVSSRLISDSQKPRWRAGWPAGWFCECLRMSVDARKRRPKATWRRKGVFSSHTSRSQTITEGRNGAGTWRQEL